MGMSLPGELRQALEWAGFDWPATDEDVLKEWAGTFRGLSGEAASAKQSLDLAVNHLHGANEGEGVAAFVAQMRGSDSNLDALQDFQTACDMAATGCETCSFIVKTMKQAVIAQLLLLAVSLAGGPLAALARFGIKKLIEMAINAAVDKILMGDA